MLDGDYYEKVQDFLSLLARTEQNYANTANECFQRVMDDAFKISREFNTQCFLQEKPVLNAVIQYQFEPQDGDEVTQLSGEHGADLTLNKEARKWSAKVIRDMRTIRSTTKQINMLLDQIKVAKLQGVGSVEGVSASYGNKSDLVTHCENLRDVVRKAETAKARAEARLEALRGAGINVDEWLAENVQDDDDDDNDEADENTTEGRLSPAVSAQSDLSDRVHVPVITSHDGVGMVPLPNRRSAVGITSGNGDTYFGTLSSQVISEEYTVVESYPVNCVAMYDYQAMNADELSLTENESLEIVGAGDGDGWLLARNGVGTEGLVPENYIRIWNPVDDVGDNDMSEVSVDDDTQLDNHRLAASVSYKYNSYSDNDVWVKALFSRAASCDEELSFTEGQLICVQSKQPNGVDDGWWIGESNGNAGLFPSMMVQELTPDVLFPSMMVQELTADVIVALRNILTEEANENESDAVYIQALGKADLATGVTRSNLDLQYLFTEGTESSV